MHPILAFRGRLGPYLAAWVPLAGLLAGLLAVGGMTWLQATVVALPLAVVYAFMCLAAWYPCRSAPLRGATFAKVVVTQLAAAALSAILWLFFADTWVVFLEQFPAFAGVGERFPRLVVVLLAVGVVLYVLGAALHYLLIGFEEAQQAERNALKLEVAAREAELRALRAQVDPHFLFNTLNSISSLIGADPARRGRCASSSPSSCGRACGSAERHDPLAEEVALAERYLGIERVRFGRGSAWSVTWTAGPACPFPRWCCSRSSRTPSDTAWAASWREERFGSTRAGPATWCTCRGESARSRPARRRPRRRARQRARASAGALRLGRPSASPSGADAFRVELTASLAGAFRRECDDERCARSPRRCRPSWTTRRRARVLREYLDAHPDVEVVAECANGFEAVRPSTTLPTCSSSTSRCRNSGFEVLDLVGAGGGGVRHRLRRVRAAGLRVHAVDYLLKPFGRAPRRGARPGAAAARPTAAAGPEVGRRRPAAGLPLARCSCVTARRCT